MSSDTNGARSDDLIDSFRVFPGLDKHRKDVLLSGSCPVLPEQPFLGFPRVPFPQHAPELFKHIGINATEGLRCNHMTVVIGPTPKHLVELFNHDRYRGADVFSDYRSHL